MSKTAQIVDFKEEKKLRKNKPLLKDHKIDFAKFRKLLDSTKKE